MQGNSGTAGVVRAPAKGRWQEDRRPTDQEQRRGRYGSARRQPRRAGGAEAEEDLLGVGADLLVAGRRWVLSRPGLQARRTGEKWRSGRGWLRGGAAAAVGSSGAAFVWRGRLAGRLGLQAETAFGREAVTGCCVVVTTTTGATRGGAAWVAASAWALDAGSQVEVLRCGDGLLRRCCSSREGLSGGGEQWRRVSGSSESERHSTMGGAAGCSYDSVRGYGGNGQLQKWSCRCCPKLRSAGSLAVG